MRKTQAEAIANLQTLGIKERIELFKSSKARMHGRIHLVVAPKIIQTIVNKLKALELSRPDDPDYLLRTQQIYGYLNQITQIEPRSHLKALCIMDNLKAAQQT